jgi:predicted phage terminase large subunit-like protein
MPNFQPAGFHEQYYKVLSDFADGDILKLMVFMPPQHGKSEGSTRRLPAFILGQNPDTKVVIVSYSAPKARKFNREIQRVIDSEAFSEIFPLTRLNASNLTTVSGGWLRNADEVEIVGYRGGFKTVGTGGALTGEPADILILDDLYKDAQSAWSPVIRDGVQDWYNTVAETRLHNDSQQLIVFTRWHEDDLAGVLLREQGEYNPITNPNGWTVVVYPAIKEGSLTEYDNRSDGEALWPERHSIEKLRDIQARSPHVFESLYQQNPKPHEGLMYERGFKTYHYGQYPSSRRRKIKNYTDTADTGADFLCSIDYIETELEMYVVDILYTDKPMEYTEVETARMLNRDQVQVANIESNNGGRGFARNVERELRMMGNHSTVISWFTQTQNKDVRIFSKSNEVQNIIYFPEDWERRWPLFAKGVLSYRKSGGNRFDDHADCVTGMAEYFGRERNWDAIDDMLDELP